MYDSGPLYLAVEPLDPDFPKVTDPPCCQLRGPWWCDGQAVLRFCFIRKRSRLNLYVVIIVIEWSCNRNDVNAVTLHCYRIVREAVQLGCIHVFPE